MSKFKNILQGIRPVAAVALKGGSKLFPVLGLLSDWIDNRRARGSHQAAPHSKGSMWVHAIGFLAIFMLLITGAVTIDDIIRLLEKIQELFNTAETPTITEP